MAKKSTRYFIILAALVCVLVLSLTLGACGKNNPSVDDGNGTHQGNQGNQDDKGDKGDIGKDDGKGDNGGNGGQGGQGDHTDNKVSVEDLSFSATLEVDDALFGTDTLTRLPSDCVYYAPIMQDNVNDGQFELSVTVTVYVYPKAGAPDSFSVNPTLKTDGSDRNVALSFEAGKDVTFTLGKLVDSKIESDLKRVLISMEIDESEAEAYAKGIDAVSLLTEGQKSAYTFNLPQISAIEKPVNYTSPISLYGVLDGYAPYSVVPFDNFTSIDYYYVENFLPTDNPFYPVDNSSGKINIAVDKSAWSGECTITDDGLTLDGNSASFTSLVGYTNCTFTVSVKSHCVEYCSSLTVNTSKIVQKYNFESATTTNKPIEVTVFGKTATVTANYYAGVYSVKPSDLPLFFADSLGRIDILYECEGTRYETIPVVAENPVEVRITAPETDADHFSANDFILTFAYDNYTTSITLGDLVASGMTFSEARTAMLSLQDAEGNSLITTHGNTTLFFDKQNLTSSKQTPRTYKDCIFPFGNGYLVDIDIKINPAPYSIAISSNDEATYLKNEYWQNEELELSDEVYLILYYHTGIYDGAIISENIPLTKDMFPSFSTETVSENNYYVCEYKGMTIRTSHSYTVKDNPIVSFTLPTDAFSEIYVKGERFEAGEITVAAVRKSGERLNVAVTEDMISGYDMNTAGEQKITIAMGEASVTETITVKEVSALSLYEELPTVYCLGQFPSEINVRADFTDGDYEIYSLSTDKIRSVFDTASAGNKTFTYTLGGKSLSADYTVVEKAFLSYTLDETDVAHPFITITGLTYDNSAEGLYFELKNCTELTIPSSIKVDGVDVAVEKIDTRAFLGQNGLISVVIPSSVTSIGTEAFRGCTSLKSLKIAAANTIGQTILQDCDSLKYLEIGSDGNSTLVEYFSTKTKDVKIPAELTVRLTDGTAAIPDGFFTGVSTETLVDKLVLPSSLVSLGQQGNGLDLVRSFESEPDGEIRVIDGVIYSDNGRTLCFYPKTLTSTRLVVGDNVTKVEGIRNNVYLQEIVFGSAVSELGDYICYECSALTSVTFTAPLSALPARAFDSCRELTSFTFPEGLTTIGEGAFYYGALKEVIIPESVTSVGHGAFGFIDNLTRIYIPSGATDSFDTEKGATGLLLRYVKEIAYSGTIPLIRLSAYNASSVTKIYVTETVCDNFANSSSATLPSGGIYATSSVTRIGSNVATIGESCTLYTELSDTSAISNNSGGKITVKAKAFIHWWTQTK